MSEAVQLALIDLFKVAIPSLIGLATIWFSYRASLHAQLAASQAQAAKDTSAAALETANKTAVLAQKTEENTNHMKDELVALTAKASHAEGKLEGEAIKATKAEGP